MVAENDSAELEALFDSVSISRPAVAAAAPAVASPAVAVTAPRPVDGVGDSPELEALFDSVASQTKRPELSPPRSMSTGVELFDSVPAPAVPAGVELFEIEPAPAAQAPEVEAGMSSLRLADVVEENYVCPNCGDVSQQTTWPGQDKVFNRLGHMMRALHDAMRELGYDKMLEKTVSAIPDARDRLNYIATLTEQAACKVLNATDVAMPVQEKLEKDSSELGEKWNRLYANQMGVDEFRQLAADTRDFLNTKVPESARSTNGQLMEIMMAQDFQDLTGQVIKKVVTLAQELESQLMGALIEVMPEVKKTDSVNSLLNGPVINSEGRSDVVVNQEQVDDLLESLGF